jgi:5-(carboxyamino)imidazole ribonucleotide mutase
MPPGIPVATVGVNAARNAGLLALQMLALSDKKTEEKFEKFKKDLKEKVVKANRDLQTIDKYAFKTN